MACDFMNIHELQHRKLNAQINKKKEVDYTSNDVTLYKGIKCVY